MTFCRLESGISTLLEEPLHSTLSSEWSVYFVLGDDFFCNGSAFWCLHQLTGGIYRIDIELSPPVEFVNSSLTHFASAILAGESFSHDMNDGVERWNTELDFFQRSLGAFDPICLQSPQNFWPRYLSFLRGEGPQARIFIKGSLSEGRQASRTGSW
jgi:hypothetical protein